MIDDNEILSYFHESWHDLALIYMKKLRRALNIKGTIYPEKNKILRVFSMPVEEINIVIVGQDPYHGPHQATGLSFDCISEKVMQPSVRNMFKEIKIEFPSRNYNFTNGSLERWFEEENIFLLNSSLSVLEHQPGSLMKFWYDFTNATIQYISEYNEKCVFLLMGSFAHSKIDFITIKTIIQEKNNVWKRKNRIIKAVHPSPMSAYRGFFNSNIFIRIEKILDREINWQN